MTRKIYHGSCHCGAVTFSADIDFATMPSQRCNCSMCTKARTWFVGVPAADVTVTSGADLLVDYTFAPKGKPPIGLHNRFCPTCGIRPYVQGHEKSLGGPFYAIAIAALDDIDGEIDDIVANIKYVDGRHDQYDREPSDKRMM